MSSRDGRVWSKVDVGLMNDTKVVALARRQRDPTRTAASTCLYVATLLASWRENGPVSVRDAAPAWYLDDIDEVASDLVAVGLLDANECIPAATLDHWMESRRAQSEAGRLGNAIRWGPSRVRSGRDPERERDRGERGERESLREREEQPKSLGETLIGMGLDPSITEGPRQ